MGPVSHGGVRREASAPMEPFGERDQPLCAGFCPPCYALFTPAVTCCPTCGACGGSKSRLRCLNALDRGA